jgi:hypothetical protein
METGFRRDEPNTPQQHWPRFLCYLCYAASFCWVVYFYADRSNEAAFSCGTPPSEPDCQISRIRLSTQRFAPRRTCERRSGCMVLRLLFPPPLPPFRRLLIHPGNE